MKNRAAAASVVLVSLMMVEFSLTVLRPVTAVPPPHPKDVGGFGL